MTITNNSPDFADLACACDGTDGFGYKVLLRRTFQPEEYLPEEAGTAKGLAPTSAITFKMTFEFTHNSAVKEPGIPY